MINSISPIKRLVPLIAVCVPLCLPLLAQDLGEVALRQALKDLGNDFRLMCVAAHPDDEDGATLAYYGMKHGIATHALIATRGEGGQNEIGPELYSELGVIRTREMMAASRIEGATLHYLDLPEFGYSKSRDETYNIWGKENTLRRLVAKIREIRPHVIVTHHSPGGGHGHHRAIGTTLIEAFDAAADPAIFPEQIEEGLLPWQTLRLYGRASREDTNTVLTPIDELEPIRGKTYSEIAANALREHRSQGMDGFIDRFLDRDVTEYGLVKEAPQPSMGSSKVMNDFSGPLFAGLLHENNEERQRLANTLASRKDVQARLRNFAPSRTDNMSIFDYDELIKKVDVARKIASEVRLTATVNDTTLVPGQTFKATLSLYDFGARDYNLTGATFTPENKLHGDWAPKPLDTNDDVDYGAFIRPFELTVPNNEIPSLPHAKYLLDGNIFEPRLKIQVAAIDTTGLTTLLTVGLNFDIAPPIGIEFNEAHYLVRTGSTHLPSIDLLLTNYTSGPKKDSLSVLAPPRWNADNPVQDVQFTQEDEQSVVSIQLNRPENLPPGDYTVSAALTDAKTVATAKLRVVDLAVPGNIHIGVIRSYDDTMQKTLELLKVSHRFISLGDYTPATLDTFTTIIVDIRAYQYNPDIVANNQALLDYARRGGTLIVMYQKTREWESEFAPYPLRVSRNRVTVEEALIEILQPKHPLFNIPNKIGATDWGGWIQERGLYFPRTWDDAYTALIACSDPEENIPPGSTLIASVGEGTYLYTALGWYRQLRELHPGVLRIFANMLAL